MSNRKSPRTFTPEFKQEAMKLVTEHGYNQQEAAESLGISSRNLNRWLNDAKRENITTIKKEDAEVVALRKEVLRLKLEKEILKKAAAFFAKELS